MAFDFPASPSEGQEFTPPSGPTYVFTSPVWKFKNIPAGATVYVGDNPPAAPFPGMLWWDSDLGSLYIYYADGSSSQWVQANINASVLADFVKKTGDTMSGNLSINNAVPSLSLSKDAAGQAATIYGRTAGSRRWSLALGSTGAEPGDGSGSTFLITRYADDSSAIGGVLQAFRNLDYVEFPLGQLKFPTTANPSTNANILDDYVEGSWVPTLTVGGSSAGITYSLQRAYYRKVGSLVTVWSEFTLSNKGAGSGNLVIEGLPYAVALVVPVGTFISGVAAFPADSSPFVTPSGTVLTPQIQLTTGVTAMTLAHLGTATGTIRATAIYLAAN